MASIIADGPEANRPPHCTFAGRPAWSGLSPKGEILSMHGLARRKLLKAGATLSATLLGRKGWAQPLDDISALKPAASPAAVPDITFLSDDGSEHHLFEFEGRGVVLNFWATWCAPCVAELPGLSKLAGAVASQNIAVLPLSADRGGALVVQRFYEQHGVHSLPILLDPKGAAARAFGVSGLPTTIIIDKNGQERARLMGGADWSTEAASRKVRELAG